MFLMLTELSGLVGLPKSGNRDKTVAVMNARLIVPVAVSIDYRKGVQGRKGGGQ